MVKSKSEQFLEARSAPPPVTPQMYKAVSSFRRDGLENEVLEGKFREPGVNSSQYTNLLGKTGAGNVTGSGSGIRKNAQFSDLSSSSSGSTGAGWRGPGGTSRQTPEMYSPLWLNSNLNLPRDKATINAWCRSFFALNPFVQNAISLHSTYPISKLNIKCHNKKVEDFFGQMADEIDLINVCIQVAQEYWTLGETFIYGELDERTAKWSRLLIQNPDYMNVQRSVVSGDPIISLRPDENLKKICTSNSPAAVQQRQQLDRGIIEHVKKGENIPLSNFYISHLAKTNSPYEVRGTSLIVSIFRDLMLFDKLREADYAIADNMVTPLTLVKIGGGQDNYKPTPADLEAWKEVFSQAQYDKDFKIFTHEAVTVEKVGSGQAIFDTSSKIERLIKNIYVGLMVPSVIMDGGGDVTYSNGGITLDVLRQRYMSFREKLSQWLRRKIFAPIAKINDFYEIIEGQKVLIVPEIEWNHMSLFDMSDYINNLIQLANGEAKTISKQTLYRSLGLDYDDEKSKMHKEMIDEAIRAKELAALGVMPLEDLRSLGDGDVIKEPITGPLPGENTGETVPDGAGGLGEGLPGVGGMGGLGSPPPSEPAPSGGEVGGIPTPPVLK